MAKKPVKKKPAARPAKKTAAKVAKPAKAAGKKVSAKGSAKKPAPKVAKKAAPGKKLMPPAKPAVKPMAAGKKAAPKAAEKGKKAEVKPETKPIPEKLAKKGRGKPEVEEAEAPIEAVGEEAGEAEEVVLTDAEGRRYCRVKDCDQLATVDGYCRYHYLLYWKKIQVRKKILSEGKLERYVEELTARYPDKFLEMLRKDLRSEKEFLAAIQELEIDESASENEFEDETQTYIDEVRGMAEPGNAREEEDF